jgi:hypothetical protein
LFLYEREKRGNWEGNEDGAEKEKEGEKYI